MKSVSDAHPESISVRFADYIGGQKEAILREWRVRVRADTEIVPTRSLDNVELTDHLPQIFDDLNGALRRYGCPTIAEQAREDAVEHGVRRWHQGYDVCEVLRELKHLRSLFVFHLRAFEELHPEYGSAAMLFVSTVVHRFFDEVSIDATKEFLSLAQFMGNGHSIGNFGISPPEPTLRPSPTDGFA